MLTFEQFKEKVKIDPKLLKLKKHIIAEIKNKKSDAKFGELGYMNSLSSNALKVGSIKVSTINLARIAYESKGNEDKFIKILKQRAIVDLEILEVVRHIIKRNVEKGLLPNFADGILDFEHLYNTVGINGIYETMKSFGYTYIDELGNTFYKDEAFTFGKKIFEELRSTMAEFTSGKDYMANVELVPGETAAVKFLQADKMLYPKQVIKDLPLYGNLWLALGINATLAERTRICSAFDGYCNGGSIMHINVDRPFTNEEQAWKMLNYVADAGVTYFAFNGKISGDKNNHLFYGDICPTCGERKTFEATRTVGFYTKTNTWSNERKEEYKLRKWMDLNK